MLGRRRQQVLAGRRREQIEKVFKADALGLRNMQLRGCLGCRCGQRRRPFHRSGERYAVYSVGSYDGSKMSPVPGRDSPAACIRQQL